MARKKFRTPPALPLDTQCRGTVVPASREWLGLYSDALLELTYAYNYEQVEATDLTPEETAQAAYLQYLTWLDSTCEGGDCPPVVIPGTDGPVFRRSPTTFLLTQLQGEEWATPDAEYIPPDPAPRTETDEYDKQCGAASNAANVLHNLYDTCISVYDDQISPALNQAELAAQIATAIGSMFGPISASFMALSGFAWEVFQQGLIELTTDDWSAEWNSIFVCLLRDHMTLDGSTAHFDFQGICWDLVGFILPILDQHTRVRWQVYYLLQCIGPEGLDIAGGTTEVEGDCADCDTWCVTWEGERLNNGDWTIEEGYWAGSDVAWTYYSPPYDGAYRRILMTMNNVDTSDCVIEGIGARVYKPAGAVNAYLYTKATPGINDANAYNYFAYNTGIAYMETTVNQETNSSLTNCSIRCTSNDSNAWRLVGIRIRGRGRNPWGSSNC